MHNIFLLFTFTLTSSISFENSLKKLRNQVYEFKLKRDSFVSTSEAALEECEKEKFEFCNEYDEIMSESYDWWHEDFKPKIDDFLMKFLKKKPKTKDGVDEVERWKQFYYHSKSKGRSMSNAWEVRGKELHEAEMWFWLEWNLDFLSWNLEGDGIEEIYNEGKTFYLVPTNMGEYYFDVTNRDVDIDWDATSTRESFNKKWAEEIKRKGETIIEKEPIRFDPPPDDKDEL